MAFGWLVDDMLRVVLEVLVLASELEGVGMLVVSTLETGAALLDEGVLDVVKLDVDVGINEDIDEPVLLKVEALDVDVMGVLGMKAVLDALTVPEVDVVPMLLDVLAVDMALVDVDCNAPVRGDDVDVMLAMAEVDVEALAAGLVLVPVEVTDIEVEASLVLVAVDVNVVVLVDVLLEEELDVLLDVEVDVEVEVLDVVKRR